MRVCGFHTPKESKYVAESSSIARIGIWPGLFDKVNNTISSNQNILKILFDKVNNTISSNQNILKIQRKILKHFLTRLVTYFTEGVVATPIYFL